jgi:2',3'-cyclic-nucleotide 2'-phosphodiesterase (5'-nucleotidase family)
VAPDGRVQALVSPALERGRGARERPLGVTVHSTVPTRYDTENPLTNLVADMTLAAAPGADVGLMNAGGVRVDLPAGPLTYGALYATLPFDNRLVRVRMRARALREVLAQNARGDAGVLGVAGVRVAVRCEGALTVTLTREDGRAVTDEEVLQVATNDYLATGALGRHLEAPLDDAQVLDAPVLRDAVAATLAREAPTLSGEDPRWYDRSRPRWALPSPRPVRCGR